MIDQIIDNKMNKFSEFSLKKSRSLYQNKKNPNQSNPEQPQSVIQPQSKMEEMIFQKYNFNHRHKTNSFQNRQHSKNNKSYIVPSANLIVISQFQKIEETTSGIGQVSLLENNKILRKQKQNSIEIHDYAFVHPPPRKISDYKDCIKRIQMNSTYRGFNSTKNQFQNKNRYPDHEKVETERNQDSHAAPFKAAERKRIIQYIIEKGFARKMQDSLIRVRNEKRKFHNDIVLRKNTQLVSPSKIKRAVVFSQTESLPTVKAGRRRNEENKEQEIEPW